MKKALLTFGLALISVALVEAQGTLKFYNINGTFLVSTNGNGFGAGPGVTDKTPGDYYYALLYDATTPTSANLLTGGWTLSSLVGTNNSIVAGGITGPGGSTAAGTPVAGTTAGGAYYIELVGYSASLTANMTLQQMLDAYYGVDGEFWFAYGYFGVSTYNGNTVTLGGAGTPAGPPSAIFGSNLPISSGFDLNFVGAIPEPTTIALACLGGMALLGLRRKK